MTFKISFLYINLLLIQKADLRKTVKIDRFDAKLEDENVERNVS